MPNKNNCILSGHLGQDPNLRYTPNGTAVCTFSLAEAYGKKENRQTQWHRVVVWGDLAEAVADNFKKGDAIQVEGPYRSRKWTDKEGQGRESWELTAYQVSKPVYQRKQEQPTAAEGGDEYDDDSEIPF